MATSRRTALRALGFSAAVAAGLLLFLRTALPFAVNAGPLALNHLDNTARLSSSGMPTRAQLDAIAAAGFGAVVNLAPDDAFGAHADEQVLVERRGMRYAHVPVDFAAPTLADYERVARAIRESGDRRVLVHCQINLRASTFVFLYRVIELGEDPDAAFDDVVRIWQGPSGPFNGLQAEKARIPYAHVNMVKLPDEVNDDQAILLSDIFPTGWFGAELADIEEGRTVAVFGCGPVGQFAIASARMMGAGRVIAVDHRDDRLAMARRQGAECINFDREDPVATIVAMTGGIGVDRVIDAVGVDAEHAHAGPAARKAEQQKKMFEQQVKQVAPEQHPRDGQWQPGDAPGQALQWAVEALAKAGTLSIIGVYPPSMDSFPLGQAMNKNITIKMGNCNHRRYVPHLIELVRSGAIDPTEVLTEIEPLSEVIGAYEAFDRREPGWMKVELMPAA